MGSLVRFKCNKTIGLRPLSTRRMLCDPAERVYDSVLDIVGNTPLIRLNKIPKEYDLKCDIYAKCEFLNPSGSNKDRIGKSMVQDKIDKGLVHPDTVFVEPTSGNTGIGIALTATLHGNGCIVVTKEKNSGQKVSTLNLLGAEVIQIKNTENEADTAAKVIAEDPKRRLMLGQFDNPVNPRTHYEDTGLEIARALNNKIDMLVMGAGTGGTISGVGKRLKEDCSDCKVVVAEPDGSTMMNPNSKAHPYLIEGIGGQEVPANFDKAIVDNYEVVTDEKAFLMARAMAIKEGLLCGGSAGAIMCAAIKAAQDYNLQAHHNIVVILPDGIRNYMDKFVCDQWMEAMLFKDPPKHTMQWWDQPITKLDLAMKYPTIIASYSCADALEVMKTKDIALVLDCKDYFVGAVSKDSLRSDATNPKKFPEKRSEAMDFNSPVTCHLVKHCHTLSLNGKKGVPTIGRLSRVLDITPFVVIGNNCIDGSHFIPDCVITADDVLDYIYSKSKKGPY